MIFTYTKKKSNLTDIPDIGLQKLLLQIITLFVSKLYIAQNGIIRKNNTNTVNCLHFNIINDHKHGLILLSKHHKFYNSIIHVKFYY